jgi:hypothetical protein
VIADQFIATEGENACAEWWFVALIHYRIYNYYAGFTLGWQEELLWPASFAASAAF